MLLMLSRSYRLDLGQTLLAAIVVSTCNITLSSKSLESAMFFFAFFSIWSNVLFLL